MTRRRASGLAALAVLALAAAACGQVGPPEGASATSKPPTTAAPPSLPPVGALDLEPTYGKQLAELGLRLTSRGGLIDTSDGGYVSSATGTHLALYVEPIADRTTAEYIDGIRAIPAIFGDLFERWPGLESYDVCQEPVDPDGTQSDEPLPVTQIALTKAQAAAIDWSTVTVVDLVRLARSEPRGVALAVGTPLSRDPAFTRITKEALGV